MRFKQQFEFHKVPEWDDFYFPYDRFLDKIEYVCKKMLVHNKMQKVNADKFGLSDSFHLTEEQTVPEEPGFEMRRKM